MVGVQGSSVGLDVKAMSIHGKEMIELILDAGAGPGGVHNGASHQLGTCFLTLRSRSEAKHNESEHRGNHRSHQDAKF